MMKISWLLLVVSVAGVAEARERLPSPEAADKILARLDADKDGKISAREAEASSRLAQRFAKVDTDRDGFLTKAELTAALDRRR